jgi:glutamine synthetase
MDRKTIQDVLNKKNIKYIRFQFTDILGTLRGLEVPVRLLDNFINDGIGIDGSSVGFLLAESSDLKIQPDLSTFQILPWNTGIAKMTCDVKNSDDTALNADPRTILKKQLARLTDKQWSAQVRPELEYYLVDEDEPAEFSRYMDLEPFDMYDDLRREVVDYCLHLGMDVKYAHAEVGPGQQEIEMGFTEPLRAADELQMMKQIVRIVAANSSLIATFLPKPFSGQAGNGLHVHQRLLDKNGDSVFGNEKELTDEGRHYVGGLLKHAPAMTAFFNPITNSYKRLVPGHEAPVYICWGIANRTALVRVPGYEKSIRMEFRSADTAANIYLILALQIAAGLDGIENKIEPPKEVRYDVSKISDEEREKQQIQLLPESLWSAIQEMKHSTLVREVLGDELINIFLKVKEKEWDEDTAGSQSVPDWEFNKFLHYG